MSSYKKLWVQRAVALLTFMAVLGAVSARTEPPFTLKSAVRYALNNKAVANKAKLDITNAHYQAQAVRAGILPQINGFGGILYNPALQQTVVPGDFVGKPGSYLLAAFGQKWGAITGISLNQTIFDASALIALKASQAASQYYVLSAQLTDEQITEQVATNYYLVLLQKQKIADVDSSILNITRIKKISEAQFKNGLSKKLDLDRLSVTLSNLYSQRQQLTNVAQQFENVLKFYMGMDMGTTLDFPPSAIQEIVPDFSPDIAPVDLKTRTGYKALQQQESLLSLQLETINAGYFPTLSFAASYTYQGSSNIFPVGKDEAQGAFWFNYSSVALNLKVPIFNGLSNRIKVKQQKISIQKLQSDMEDAYLGLSLDFQNAVSQIKNSLITLRSQTENINLAKEVYTETRNNYNSGLASLTDLLESENSLTAAQNNYTSALLDYKLAEIQIAKAKGTLMLLAE